MKRGATHASAAVVAAAVLLAPAAALALCPNCLGQQRTLPVGLQLVGGFLVVPFLIFFVVLRVVRAAARADRAPRAR
jgi:hypothetical protein